MRVPFQDESEMILCEVIAVTAAQRAAVALTRIDTHSDSTCVCVLGATRQLSRHYPGGLREVVPLRLAEDSVRAGREQWTQHLVETARRLGLQRWTEMAVHVECEPWGRMS